MSILKNLIVRFIEVNRYIYCVRNRELFLINIINKRRIVNFFFGIWKVFIK